MNHRTLVFESAVMVYLWNSEDLRVEAAQGRGSLRRLAALSRPSRDNSLSLVGPTPFGVSRAILKGGQSTCSSGLRAEHGRSPETFICEDSSHQRHSRCHEHSCMSLRTYFRD